MRHLEPFGCDKGSGLTYKPLLPNLMQTYKYLDAFFFLAWPKLQKKKQFEIEFMSWFEFHLKNFGFETWNSWR